MNLINAVGVVVSGLLVVWVCYQVVCFLVWLVGCLFSLLEKVKIMGSGGEFRGVDTGVEAVETLEISIGNVNLTFKNGMLMYNRSAKTIVVNGKVLVGAAEPEAVSFDEVVEVAKGKGKGKHQENPTT